MASYDWTGRYAISGPYRKPTRWQRLWRAISYLVGA